MGRITQVFVVHLHYTATIYLKDYKLMDLLVTVVVVTVCNTFQNLDTILIHFGNIDKMSKDMDYLWITFKFLLTAAAILLTDI